MATFGKTTDGASVQTFSGARIYLSTATPVSSGVVTNGSGRIRVSATGSFLSRMVIFADSAGVPSTFLAESDEVTVNWTVSALTNFPFSGANQITITSGTPYWIGFWSSDPGTPSYEYKRDNNSLVNNFASDAYPGAGTPTSPFVSAGTSNGPLNASIDYTVSGATFNSQAMMGHLMAASGIL
jgi:hypothetical protein